MTFGILAALRWSRSFGAKCFRVVPVETTVVVLATLVSQVAILLAFFLPLKVVILLGSEGMPRYFPTSFASVDRNVLIVALSLSAIGSYVIHLLAEQITSRSTERGARRVLDRSRKTVLFHNHEEVATSGYRRYTSVLASGIFVALALLALIFLYPALALLVVGYVGVSFAVLLVLYRTSEPLQSRIATHLAVLMSVIGAVGFLAAFAYLVADFILGSPPGLLVAIISLLLSRQLFNRGAGLVSDLTVLYGQRVRLNALFFHGQTLDSAVAEHEQKFWALLDRERRQQWLPEVISAVTGERFHNSGAEWVKSEISGVVTLHARPGHLVKLFDKGRRSLAQHEFLLISECKAGLPALPLVGVDAVGGYTCHVYEGFVGSDEPDTRQAARVLSDIRVQLMAVEPPAALVDRFRRSRPFLSQRLTDSMLERLIDVVAERDDLDHIRRFGAGIHSIRERLSALPLYIHNPNLQWTTLAQRADGQHVVLDWGRWSLEPLGAGWPMKGAILNTIPDALLAAAPLRRELGGVRPEDVRLAALVSGFEIQFLAQKYIAAMALLPIILDCLDSADPTSA